MQTLTHLRDVEGGKTDGEDDQHGAQQVDCLPPPLPEETDKSNQFSLMNNSSSSLSSSSISSIYLLCCISRRSASAHMIRTVKTTMTTRGRKNSVTVRKSSFERHQPACWKAVERKE